MQQRPQTQHRSIDVATGQAHTAIRFVAQCPCSKLGGRGTEVWTREGDLVEIGQMLVRFGATGFEAQCSQVLT